MEALDICGKIEGIGVVQFTDKDVVRHNLVQRIIRAYEDYDGAQPARGIGRGDRASGSVESAGSEKNGGDGSGGGRSQ